MQWVGNELSSTQSLVPPIICTKCKYQSLSWSNTNSFHSPISHPLPLSLEEQEWGRTRKRRWRWNGDGGGRWNEGMQTKAILSSRSSHPYLMIMVSSWALISLVEDFSLTLISISHACMNHGVWWPLTHHKGNNPLSWSLLSHEFQSWSKLPYSISCPGYKLFMGRDLDKPLDALS